MSGTARQSSPQRTCVGCRVKRPQPELVRVVRTDDGDLRVGRSEPGRGAWVCSPACVVRAAARKAFDRALRGSVRTDAIERLRAYLVERERMDGRVE